jgi:hypothetical protein
MKSWTNCGMCIVPVKPLHQFLNKGIAFCKFMQNCMSSTVPFAVPLGKLTARNRNELKCFSTVHIHILHVISSIMFMSNRISLCSFKCDVPGQFTHVP